MPTNAAFSSMTSKPPMSGLEANSDLFRCPRCLSAVDPGENGLTCRSCHSTYAVRDGIADLRCQRQDYYFNPVPREQMAALVRQASMVSWDETVREFLRHVKSVPDWIDNVVVNGRYSWKLFLDLPPDARVLDFGCGLGNLSQSIAPHVGEVVALDLTWERLQFAQQRFARFNRGSRITPVAAGDGVHLPFPDDSFDAITLSGVLEWIPEDPSLFAVHAPGLSRMAAMLTSFFGETNPRKSQIRFLKELRRIMKPNGQLFVAIENRWNYEYFQGRRDHHSGLKYGALLPRLAANVYSIAKRGKAYRTYTHTYGGLKRVLRAAGFAREERLGLTPGYTGLSEVLPLQADDAFWQPPPAGALKERVRRNRYFVPAFGIIGRNGTASSRSLIGRVLATIEHTTPALGPISLHTCLVTGKEKVVFTASSRSGGIVIKVPADEAARAGEIHNRLTLARLGSVPSIAPLVPAPIAHGVHQAVEYFVESAVHGVSLRSALRTMPRAAAASKLRDLMLRLHEVVAPPAHIAGGSGELDDLLVKPLSVLRSAGLDAGHCDAVQQALGGIIASTPWSLGLYHGDFSKNNIFAAQEEITGVIDWEYAVERGLPLLDAIGYVDSVRRLIDKWAGRPASMSSNMERLAHWEWDTREELDLLEALYRHFNVDRGLHQPLCHLAWLQHMSRTLQTKVRFDTRVIEGNAGPMLASIAQQ